jgi:Domain of unknown function (DUF4440)
VFSRHSVAVAVLLGTAMTVSPSSQSSDIAALLQRQTQEMMDAIAAGDRTPWTRYLDEAVVYAAEDGTTKSKAQLVEEIRPFPKEIWGKLRVTEFRTALHGKTAVTNYISEEDQGYFGQVMHARYLSTDTWIDTAAGWRLVASQVLALRDDPPEVRPDGGKLDEYVGVYALTPDVTYAIRRDGDRLVGTRTGRKTEPLRVELADCLFVPGQPRLRKVFQRDANGHVTGFVERRESWDIAWRRVP